MFKRIVLKISGEFLGNLKEGESISVESLQYIAEIVNLFKKRDIEVGIVTGAGNIMRGGKRRQSEKYGRVVFTRTIADRAGMLGTVINSLLLVDYLTQYGINSVVMSTIQISGIQFFTPEKARELLSQGITIVYAGGTSNPFVTTDTSAVIKALETFSDALVKATKVDGLYTDDPIKNPSAKFIKEITYRDYIESRYKIMDISAVALAMENNLPIYILNFYKKEQIKDLLEGKETGSIIRG